MDYLSTCIDQVQTFGDILQLVIVELIYKVKGKYIVMSLENTGSIRPLSRTVRIQLEKAFWPLVHVKTF